jgi:AcrR family transcriptional regulator
MAKVNQGLIRHHFAGKELLWRAVVEAELAALVADLERSGRDPARESRRLPRPIAELNRVLAGHAQLVQMITHALLEPGARRQWLLREQLGPVWGRAAAWLGSNTVASSLLGASEQDALLWSWAAAALAGPCFGAALAELVERPLDVGAAARVQTEILERCAMPRPALAQAGPWSVPAAVRRRLGLRDCSRS